MHASIRISCCLSVCICIDTTMRNIRRESAKMKSRAALSFVVAIIAVIIIVVIIVIIVILVLVVIIVIFVLVAIVVIIVIIV